MRKLIVFNQITLDGYFAGMNGDISWAHATDDEWKEFVNGNASGGGELVFGRITYEMMASYWPTPMAARNDPVVAKGMNELPKVVFSRTMEKASWSNTRLLKGDLATEVRTLKGEPGKDLVIMGSGTIIAQIAAKGLIDEYQVIVYPVAIGGGRTMFEGIAERLALNTTRTRTFRNGNVLLCYEPA